MKKFLRAIINYIGKGLLVVLPLGAAIFLIGWIIATIDSTLNLSSIILVDQAGRPVYIPGLGILSALILLLVAGIIVTNLITEPIYDWFGKVLHKIPVLSFFYTSIKDLTEAFVGEDKKFNEPVIVELNDCGLKRVGFLTQKDLAKLGMPGEVAVYFPFSYSFAGQLCIVPADKVKPLNMNAGEAMKFIVSGGVSHI